MSVKMHFLSLHLDHFPDNCGDYSKEQGEQFHQDLWQMEKRYQGYWDINMLADYCWCLKRDLPNSTHRRKIFEETFLVIINRVLSKYHHVSRNTCCVIVLLKTLLLFCLLLFVSTEPSKHICDHK